MANNYYPVSLLTVASNVLKKLKIIGLLIT